MSEFLYLLLVFAAALAAFLALFNNIVVTRRYTVKTKKPVNLKLALITDFHDNKNLIPQILERVAAFAPDVIILGGDMADRRKSDHSASASLIKSLSGMADLYAVTGNHEAELGAATPPQLATALIDGDYRIFENYAVLGLGDPLDDDFSKDEDLVSLFSRLPQFKIAAVHRPYEFFSGLTLKDRDIDLVLSGHCHGGLFRLPFFGPVYAPGEGFFPKYAYGKTEENGKTLIVSGGAGNTVFPLRLNNFPEVVCINVEGTDQ